jgi:hypothetical protein
MCFQLEIICEHDMQLEVDGLGGRAPDRFFCILRMNSILFRLGRFLLGGLCVSMLLGCFGIPYVWSSLVLLRFDFEFRSDVV